MTDIHTESYRVTTENGVFVFEKDNTNELEVELYNPAYFRAIGFGDAEVSLVVRSEDTQVGGGVEPAEPKPVVIHSPYEAFLYLFGNQSSGDKPSVSWFDYIRGLIQPKKDAPEPIPAKENTPISTSTSTEPPKEIQPIKEPPEPLLIKDIPEPSVEPPPIKEPSEPLLIKDIPEPSVEPVQSTKPVPEPLPETKPNTQIWRVKIPQVGEESSEECVWEDAEIESRQVLRQVNYKMKMKGRVYRIGNRSIVLGEVVPIKEVDPREYPKGTIMEKTQGFLMNWIK